MLLIYNRVNNVQRCTKYLMCKVSLNCHNPFMRYELCLLLLAMIKLRLKSMNLPKVTKLWSGGTRIWLQVFLIPESMFLTINVILLHDIINPPCLWAITLFPIAATISSDTVNIPMPKLLNISIIVYMRKFSRRGIAKSKGVTRTRRAILCHKLHWHLKIKSTVGH